MARRVFLIFVLSLLTAFGVLAQEKSRFKVLVPSDLRVGGQFMLSYIITADSVWDVKIPLAEGLEVLAGPFNSKTESVRMVNGKKLFTRSFEFKYILEAKKEGVFTLPQASVIADGQLVYSDKVQIKIFPLNMGWDTVKNDLVVDPILVRVEGEDDVYDLFYAVYTVLDSLGIDRVEWPDFKDFRVEEIELPRDRKWQIGSLNGITYNMTNCCQFRLYPKKTGKLSIGSARFFMGTRKQVKQDSSVDLSNSIPTYTRLKKKLTTRELTVEVKKLPGEKPVRYAPIREIVKSPDLKVVRINRFETDYQFRDGMLAIYNKELRHWGFINEKGDLAIDYKWDYSPFGKPCFSGGYCMVAKQKQTSMGIRYLEWYILDKTGKAVRVPGDVKSVSEFRDGYAAVVKALPDNKFKYVYVNGQGREVFPAISHAYTQLIFTLEHPCPCPSTFHEDRAAFYDFKKSKFGYINRKGEIVIPAVYAEVQDFRDGLAAVKVEGTDQVVAKWGYINTKGNMVIPPTFSIEPLAFSEGFAVVEKRNGKMVMIDKAGSVVCREYDKMSPFQDGYAFAEDGLQGAYVLDARFKEVKGPIEHLRLTNAPFTFYHNIFYKPADFKGDGFYYNNGEEYKLVYGWALGMPSENLIHCRTNEVDGFINYKGELVIVFENDEF